MVFRVQVVIVYVDELIWRSNYQLSLLAKLNDGLRLFYIVFLCFFMPFLMCEIVNFDLFFLILLVDQLQFLLDLLLFEFVVFDCFKIDFLCDYLVIKWLKQDGLILGLVLKFYDLREDIIFLKRLFLEETVRADRREMLILLLLLLLKGIFPVLLLLDLMVGVFDFDFRLESYLCGIPFALLQASGDEMLQFGGIHYGRKIDNAVYILAGEHVAFLIIAAKILL